MELAIFARFHARPVQEAAVAEAILDVIAPTSREPGGVAIDAFRGRRDPRLFYIHSRWVAGKRQDDGTVRVARWAARTAGVSATTITSTLRRTSSAASPARRSCRPSAYRASMRAFCPST